MVLNQWVTSLKWVTGLFWQVWPHTCSTLRLGTRQLSDECFHACFFLWMNAFVMTAFFWSQFKNSAAISFMFRYKRCYVPSIFILRHKIQTAFPDRSWSELPFHTRTRQQRIICVRQILTSGNTPEQHLCRVCFLQQSQHNWRDYTPNNNYWFEFCFCSNFSFCSRIRWMNTNWRKENQCQYWIEFSQSIAF